MWMITGFASRRDDEPYRSSFQTSLLLPSRPGFRYVLFTPPSNSSLPAGEAIPDARPVLPLVGRRKTDEFYNSTVDLIAQVYPTTISLGEFAAYLGLGESDVQPGPSFSFLSLLIFEWCLVPRCVRAEEKHLTKKTSRVLFLSAFGFRSVENSCSSSQVDDHIGETHPARPNAFVPLSLHLHPLSLAHFSCW